MQKQQAESAKESTETEKAKENGSAIAATEDKPSDESSQSQPLPPTESQTEVMENYFLYFNPFGYIEKFNFVIVLGD